MTIVVVQVVERSGKSEEFWALHGWSLLEQRDQYYTHTHTHTHTRRKHGIVATKTDRITIYWFLHSSGFTVPAPEPPRPLGGPRLLAGASLSESES